MLDDGSRVPYDKLLIATGSNPFVPPMKGLETVEKKFSFMSLDDAKALQAALTEGSRVLIIGAGLIDLNAPRAFSKRWDNITVVDLADRFCPASSTRRLRLSCRRISRSRGSIYSGGQRPREFSPGSALLKSGKKSILTFWSSPSACSQHRARRRGGRGGQERDRDGSKLPHLPCDIYGGRGLRRKLRREHRRNQSSGPASQRLYAGECAGINMAVGKSLTIRPSR